MRAREQVTEEVRPKSTRCFINSGIDPRTQQQPRLGKSATMKHEGRPSRVLEALHLTDEDHVIAAIVPMSRLTLETGGAVLQKGRIPETAAAQESLEFIDAAQRETLSQLFLLQSQNMHREMSARFKARAAPGALVQGP